MSRFLPLLAICLFALSGVAAEPLSPAGAAPEWIWLPTAKPNQAAFFRKQFEVPAGVETAKLVATCDNQFSLYIDGKEVASGADWEAPVKKDVSSIFKSDKASTHVIAVRGRNTDNAAGLLVRIVFEVKGQKPLALVSNTSWKVAEKPGGKEWMAKAFDDKNWKPATSLGKLGSGPWTAVNEAALDRAGPAREPQATAPETLKVVKDFRVELLYSVPKDEQGSWVNMCVDPKGRLIVSNQYGALYRVIPGKTAQDTKVEQLPVQLGGAHGLLWAFDSLYVVVNEGVEVDGVKPQRGLHRVRSKDGGDTFEKPEFLRAIEGSGEHGPHAVLLGPDGKSLYVVCGNHTKLTKLDRSRVPQVWQEDHLLPRMWDAGGHAVGILAPGGWIAKTDPDGKKWELVSMGYRNEFDAAFNMDGDLFTYDSDMEWDINTPWYRPTRVCLACSGSEFGWRSGTGKWPVYYPDSLPPVVDIGPGSPTGMCFGYGAKFPVKYQQALFMCDWSYGKLYAVHLSVSGSAYKGEAEEFITGAPLPLTDIVVNPSDQAMYFTIGGRKVKSGLYRVTYAGNERTEPVKVRDGGEAARAVRRQLESFHGHKDPNAVEAAWKYLGDADRFLRFASRVAIEFQPVQEWQERALAEKNPQAALTALLALARVGDKSMQAKLLSALDQLDWNSLTHEQQLECLRVYGLAFIRMGAPDEAAKSRAITKFDRLYPAASRELNSELCQLLVYLNAPSAASKTMKLLAAAPTQEEQLDLVKSLRMLKTGWTPELRKEYFSWFLKAANYKGGHSFAGFVRNIKNEAVALLSEDEKVALRPILDAKVSPKSVPVFPPRSLVKQYKMDDVLPILDKGLSKRDFDRGRRLFAEAQCFNCHRFANEGGATGPDLSGASGRFSTRDLLESIIEPSKVISDQYAAVIVETTDGKQYHGRIVNHSGDGMMLNTNMLDPGTNTVIDRKRIESVTVSKTSLMPTGLLDTFKEDEILDLMAYLLSRGDRKHAMFQK